MCGVTWHIQTNNKRPLPRQPSPSWGIGLGDDVDSFGGYAISHVLLLLGILKVGQRSVCVP